MAEVSKIDTYRTGDLLQCIAGRANPLMDPKLFGVVLFRVVAVVTSPTTAECGVACCWCCTCPCSCSVVEVVILAVDRIVVVVVVS